MRRADVIIVGAGAAGLAAAQVLADAGRTALIVEARRRIGGRIFTIRDRHANTPIDLGAEFIHGRPQVTWDLVRAARLTPYDVPFTHLERWAGRLVHGPGYETELQKGMAGLSRLGRRDMSFADYLRRHRRGRSLAHARRVAIDFVEGFDAADPERISAKSLAEEQEGIGDVGDETQCRLLEGQGAIIEHLHRAVRGRATMRLNTAVTEVRWERHRVEVCCRRDGGKGPAEVLRAAQAIVTLPVGVLQLPPDVPGSVRFTPEVAAQRRAAMQLASGPIVKAILIFREPFWEPRREVAGKRGPHAVANASFLHDPGEPRVAFPVWWTPLPLRLPMMTAWAGGPRAVALAGKSKRELRDIAVASLALLLGRPRREVTTQLASFHAHDWASDPWSHGAYSYVTVGGGNARARLAEPIQSTLFFAGEATDVSGQASTVAGALLSGQRAAREALAARR